MLGVGAGLLVLSALSSVASVLLYAGIAYFLTLVLEPAIRWISNRGLPRGAAVALVLLGVVVISVVLVMTAGPALAAQTSALISALPGLLQSLLGLPLVADLGSQLGITGSFDDLVTALRSFLADPAQVGSLAGGLLSIGSGIVSGIEGVVVVVVLTVYFALGLPKLTEYVFRLVPRSRAVRARAVYDEMALVVGRYVSSQLLIAAINAALTLVLLLILQVPAALPLALLAFFAALVPVVGTLAAGALIIVVAFFTSPLAGIVMVIYYVTYHPFEGYVLGPRLTSKAVSVSGYAVLIAVVAGSTLGGVLGALVAVPVTAALSIVVQRVVIPRQAAR